MSGLVPGIQPTPSLPFAFGWTPATSAGVTRNHMLWMFSRHIRQANDGCDFDFLETSFGRPVGEPAIY
jgi:hypothetical protein